MIHLITYATENMSKAAELCVESAERNGVDSGQYYNDLTLDIYFDLFNKEILSQKRGAGYWLWKPYIIYRELQRLPNDSYLIYSDAGVEFINNVSHIIEKMDEDIFFFGNNWNHVDWCKRFVYDTILPQEAQMIEQRGIIYPYKQVQASVIFFKVNDNTRRFVKEWLLYCQMPDFIDDSPSKKGEYVGFQEHRHDQAILTCLQIKYGYSLHYWPASYIDGSFPYEKIEQYTDNYPIIFNHHRKRNNEW